MARPVTGAPLTLSAVLIAGQSGQGGRPTERPIAAETAGAESPAPAGPTAKAPLRLATGLIAGESGRGG
ncbi:MAG: hypothetical protein JO116_19255 [Planctomycetaceae bacterium]|nr:hypothetical protein [Planctomycetaceae bacterium]